MAGQVIEGELTRTRSGLRFAVATRNSDADIRRLLRENPMPGRISLSLEREPDYFADASLPDQTKQTIIARDGGRVVCTGSCTIRRRFVNGEPCRVGYLGGLRLDASQAGRFSILRRGYEFFHELQAGAPADFYFTSIAAGNERARALLERGLPGMPRYEFIGDYVTILVPVKRGGSFLDGTGSSKPPTEQLMAFLNDYNCKQQFAPCWSAEEMAALQPLGLAMEDFQFIGNGESIDGAAALWDQRKFKQTVVRGYTPALARARPVLNAVTRFLGGTRLPAIGETLGNAFVSHLATRADRPGSLIQLIMALRNAASRRGIELLTLGFAAGDPQLAEVRRNFRHHEYHSRLYVVRWPGCGAAACELDGRLPAPEVALL